MARWSLSLRERFMLKVASGADGCWEWKASKREHGYGQFYYQGRMRVASRVAWALFCNDGVLPESSLDVCHRCDNPSCVNPSHLFIGDRAANMRDAAAKGRVSAQRRPELHRGVRHNWTKLSLDVVAGIKAALKTSESKASIARRFGTSPSNVHDISIGKNWADNPGAYQRRLAEQRERVRGRKTAVGS